jgi:integration host factor subunit beta
MIKSELITNIAAKMTHLPENKVTECINHILELMCNSLVKGKRIEIRGFGSFTLHYRPPRKAHNPKTGERVITVAKRSPHFKPGKGLRDRINQSRELHVIHNEE